MPTPLHLFAHLSDSEILQRVLTLAQHERSATVQLIAGLMEIDRRRLHLGLGYASLFVYCTRILHLSEPAAYNRIEVARAAVRFPAILDRLEAGSLTLTAARLLAPLLNTQNHGELLDAAHHKGKRDVEILVAALRPQPDAPAVLRRLPQRETAGTSDPPQAPASPASLPTSTSVPAAAAPTARNAGELPSSVLHAPVCTPLTPERFKIQFTASREFHDKLRRAQALLRHLVPNGDPAAILDRGLDLLLAASAKQKFAATNEPRAARVSAARSRRIPAAVKREVWKRDNGRCAFVGTAGRCGEEAFLAFHHVVPFAHGGPATTANIELRCRAHNGYEADCVFKPMFAD